MNITRARLVVLVVQTSSNVHASLLGTGITMAPETFFCAGLLLTETSRAMALCHRVKVLVAVFIKYGVMQGASISVSIYPDTSIAALKSWTYSDISVLVINYIGNSLKKEWKNIENPCFTISSYLNQWKQRKEWKPDLLVVWKYWMW